MKNINFTNRRSKVKKFLIYLIPNIISLIVIYYIIFFYITVEAHGDEWYVIGLLTFIFISGLFGIYVLFGEIEKFFWSRKEKIAYKRLQNILEIKSIVESQKYKEVTNGNMTISGDVKGNINNVNGNIIAKIINGNCKTTNGDILCND